MKIFKWLWFLLSITLIITSAYFMYQNNQPKEKETVKKTVKKEASTIDYNGNIISINGINPTNARKLMDIFTSSPLAIDSWWWMPNKEIPKLENLDNEYRLTIASYGLELQTDTEIEVGETLVDANNTVTKTKVQTAWEDLVGLGVAITDGNPCTTIKYCKTFITYDKDKDVYTIEKSQTNTLLQAIKYADISLIDNEYIISLKAIYVSKNNNVYTAYTNPSKLTKIKDLDVINEGELEEVYLKRVTKDLFDQADTYQYKFKYENTAYLFSGYNYLKTSN